MIYASSKDRFKRELDGIQVELQATDPTEMGVDVIRSRTNWIWSVSYAMEISPTIWFNVYRSWNLELALIYANGLVFI